MRLMKVRFTEWRDDASPTPEQRVAASRVAECVARVQSARRSLGEANELLGVVETQGGRGKLDAATGEVANALEAAQQARAVEDEATDGAMRAMKTHPKVGTFGYQVLTDDGTECLRVVDENNQALPAKATYGYEIVDENPELPAWAKESA